MVEFLLKANKYYVAGIPHFTDLSPLLSRLTAYYGVTLCELQP